MGQNQSPSGTVVILGLWQYVWQPLSQPSQSKSSSSLSPFWQSWQCWKHQTYIVQTDELWKLVICAILCTQAYWMMLICYWLFYYLVWLLPGDDVLMLLTHLAFSFHLLPNNNPPLRNTSCADLLCCIWFFSKGFFKIYKAIVCTVVFYEMEREAMQPKMLIFMKKDIFSVS